MRSHSNGLPVGLRVLLHGFFAGLLILLSVTCARHFTYVPDPEKDINQWVANFTHQISFNYEYEAKLKSIRVEGIGFCVIGKGERLSGKWYGDGSEQDFEYVGMGDIEYSRKGVAWEQISRGEESDIFTQITRILSTDDFIYGGRDDDYEYRFKANVPFLDPLRRKEMVGMMTVSPDNFLPTRVWAGLPDSSTYWTARIFDYNSSRSIRSPAKEKREYLVTSKNGSKEDGGALEKRLDLLSVDYWLQEKSEGFAIGLPNHYSIEDATVFFKTGGMVLYAVTDKSEDASRIAYLRGDVNKPIYLTERLATERDVRDAKLRFDQSSALFISLMLRGKRPLPGKVALEVDSVLVATATLDTSTKSDRIDLYPEMQYTEMEILRAYILQPLAAYEVKASGGERR